MDELQPIKSKVIEQITKLIQQAVANSTVEVYGSHATNLCLHWSDIDLVLIPYEFNQNSGMRYPMDNYLQRVYSELRRSEHSSWISSVLIIENTSVPVIKIQCNFFTSEGATRNNCAGPFSVPDDIVFKYPDILSKPINIDITQMTDNHNGLECVQLVRSYLQESQIIEPMILVLKHMLKTWGYNDPYHGGLSSYALLLLIVSFLQFKRKPNTISEVNLGETLLEFLKYYSDLDTQRVGI